MFGDHCLMKIVGKQNEVANREKGSYGFLRMTTKKESTIYIQQWETRSKAAKQRQWPNKTFGSNFLGK